MTPADLSAFMGTELDEDRATAVLSVVSATAKAITRGAGWTDGVPDDAIRAVVLAASARLITPVGNSQIRWDESHGPSRVSFAGGPMAFSVAEMQVLNGFRVTAT